MTHIGNVGELINFQSNENGRDESNSTKQLLRKVFVFGVLPHHVPGVNINIILCIWY